MNIPTAPRQKIKGDRIGCTARRIVPAETGKRSSEVMLINAFRFIDRFFELLVKRE